MEFYNYNEKKLKAQHNYLKKCLLENDYYDFSFRFQVLDFECGSGKTIETEKIMSDITNKNNTHNYLFVRERNADGIASAERINELAGRTIAIAVNSNTFNTIQFNEIKETLTNYKVVIISHEKYKVLAVDKVNRKYFTENRQILIIDEFLDMAKSNELQISKEYINSFEGILNHRGLRNMYIEIVGELEDYLMSEKKHNTFFNAKSDSIEISKKINKLKAVLSKELTREYVKSVGFTKKEICRKLDELKQFYIQTCIVEGNIMYCNNMDYKYWFLPVYNCILDASAKLNPAYKLSNQFYIQHQSKVFDHKEWSFFIVKTNSNKKSKARAIDYYENINKLVVKK